MRTAKREGYFDDGHPRPGHPRHGNAERFGRGVPEPDRPMDMLRWHTAGSVDDGKRPIGRLLF